MNDYVSKPIDLSFLITKIERYISRQKVQKLPEWRYVNLIQLKEAAGGDQEKMLKYLGIYAAELPHDLAALKNARGNQNKEAIDAALHKIKGSLSYIGDQAVATIYTKITSMTLNDAQYYAMIDDAINTISETEKEILLIQQNHKSLPLNAEK
jgi:HPt (histidine-containing phosphotransfer) domain-containing protein